MIGQVVTDPKTGEPVDHNGNKLALSSYQPPDEVKKLFRRVQTDYQVAYALQRRTFDEFDGYSLLDRARLDQQTFGAFVGVEFVPAHKKWRFKGRKNTSRNKLIGILAHVIAGMLYPFVYAKNEQNEEDKMSARVMRILVEDKLRKAGYEVKFLFMALSALVNPAVYVGVEYVEALQKIKKKLADGTIQVIEAVDEMLSGLQIPVIPIDEIMPCDYYSGTGSLQVLPVILRIRRISYDYASSIYRGKHKDKNGKDLFEYVESGKTRVLITGADTSATLYDIEWTEADRDYVQEITAYYRSEDLEVRWVGGVYMGDETDVYNSNPFQHRRMTLVGKEWLSIPVYPFAMSGFEPIDPAGRFLFYKSAAFKEFWDDKQLNLMSRLAVDGTYLDVIKPMFLSGVGKIDSTVIAPGATTYMPQGASATPYSLGPNLTAAYNSIVQAAADLSESTQDKIMSGNVEKGVTAYATAKAEQNARVFLGVFGLMIASLVKQIGELAMDCVVQYSTVGELNNLAPEALAMRYQTFLAKSKDKGKDITNKVVFTDKYMGRDLTDDQKKSIEWSLYDEAGGEDTDQRIYMVNPYQFARTTYTMYVDPDKIVMKSMGADREQKILAFNMMTDSRVLPFTDPKAVADDFVIEEFGGDDPDRYKNKQGTEEDMMAVLMGQGVKSPGGQVVPPVSEPVQA